MSHASALVLVKGPQEKIGEQVTFQLRPFDENGRWFQDGSRWDWWMIGGRWGGLLGGQNVVRVGDLDLPALEAHERVELERHYAETMKKKKEYAANLEFMTGIKPGESLEAYLAREARGGFPATHVFVRDRDWHERSRMGWFGEDTATECERHQEAPEADEDLPALITQRCLHISKRFKARIISWAEESERWRARFYPRFIASAPKDAFLVVVDYHV